MIVEMALHTWTGAVFQTIMTAVGQNYGAGKYKRVVRSIILCLILVTVSIAVLGLLTVWNGRFLLGLINGEPDVIANGMVRIKTNLSVYFLLAVMDAFSGALRGLGRSITPTAVTLLCACGLRIVWVATAFRSAPTLETLYLAFPLSWICVSLVNGAILFFVCRAIVSGRAESRVLKILR